MLIMLLLSCFTSSSRPCTSDAFTASQNSNHEMSSGCITESRPVDVFVEWMIYLIHLIQPLKIGKLPKGKDRIPTIIFQGPMLVSGRVGIALSKANSDYNPSPQLPIYKAIIGVITQYRTSSTPTLYFLQVLYRGFNANHKPSWDEAWPTVIFRLAQLAKFELYFPY